MIQSSAGRLPGANRQPADIGYLIGKSANGHIAHAVPDSAATATALCTGIKTYNGAIGIGHTGERLTTVAHLAQKQRPGRGRHHQRAHQPRHAGFGLCP